MPELSPRCLIVEGTHVVTDADGAPLAWIVNTPAMMGFGHAQFALWPADAAPPWGPTAQSTLQPCAPGTDVDAIRAQAPGDLMIQPALWFEDAPAAARTATTTPRPQLVQLTHAGSPTGTAAPLQDAAQSWHGWLLAAPQRLEQLPAVAADAGTRSALDYLQKLILYWLQKPQLELFDAGTTEITVGDNVVGYSWLRKGLSVFNQRQEEHVVLVETMPNGQPVNGVDAHPQSVPFTVDFTLMNGVTHRTLAEFHAFAKAALTGAERLRLRSGDHNLHVVLRMNTNTQLKAGSRVSVYGPYGQNLSWSYWDKTGPLSWKFFYHSSESDSDGTVTTSAATVHSNAWRSANVQWPGTDPRISATAVDRLILWQDL